MQSQQFVIHGGNPLHGEVQVKGSKNATLALLASVFVSTGVVRFANVPNVSDVRIKLELLAGYGAKIKWDGDDLLVDCANIEHYEPSEDLVRPIRTSFYMLGPLLARLKYVKLPMPGGCMIGARPVDYHILGLEAMGATVDLKDGCYVARCEHLRGASIYLDFPSAGATQHLMATATLAEGITVIDNAAMEPEVDALGNFLIALGARIEGLGTSKITIIGRQKLDGGTVRVPADRIQAGTYLMAAAITGGRVKVKGIDPGHQVAVMRKLRESGVTVEDESGDSLEAYCLRRPRAIKVKTMPYPGFPTDMQQPMAALLSLAEGQSLIQETVYESRIGHVQELNRMGAKMRVEDKLVMIDGVPKLSGAVVEASDLRAGAALVLAGLAAKGQTTVRNIHYIDRGYEDLEQTLRMLGADIERVPYEARQPAGIVEHDQ